MLNTAYNEKLREYGLVEGLPDVDTKGAPMPFNGHPKRRDFIAYMYADIPENWSTDTSIDELYDSEGNVMETFHRVTEVGWRDLLKENLEIRLIKIIDRGTNYTEVVERELAERNHSFSRMQEDPAKKLGEKILKLVSEIEGNGINLFGKKSYLDPTEVIKNLYGILPGQTTFNGMITQMRKASKYNKDFIPILVKFSQLTQQERNLVFKNFSMAAKEFSMILIDRKPQEDGTSTKIVKIIDPGTFRQSAIKVREWKKSAEQPAGLSGSTESLYVLNPTTGKLVLNEAAANNLFKAYQAFNNEKITLERDETTSSLIKNFAQVLWYLGARYAKTRNEHIALVSTYINEGDEIQGGNIKGRVLMNRLESIGGISTKLSVEKMVRYHVIWAQRADTKEILKLTKLNDIAPNKGSIHKSFSTAYKFLAEPANLLAPQQPNSHVSGTLKQQYPINLSDSIDRLNYAMQEGTDLDHYVDKFINDPSTGMGGDKTAYRALLLKIMQIPELRRMVKLSNFDSMKDSSRYMGVDYASQGDRSSLITKLHYFVNSGNTNVTHHTVDTLGNRDRLVPMQVPRIASPETLTTLEKSLDTGGHRTLMDTLLFALAVQDLVRVGKARKDIQDNRKTPENLIVGYHYAKYQEVNGVTTPIDASNPAHLTYMTNESGTAFDSSNFQLSEVSDEEFNSSGV